MAIIERAKCPACGADHRVDAKHCPACGVRLPKPAADKDRHGGKPRPAPAGLDPDALLAKIDALDWDGPLTVPAPPATTIASPVQQRSWLKLMAGTVAVLAVGLLAFYLSLSDDDGAAAGTVRDPAAAMAPALVASSAPAAPAGSETASAEQLALVEAAERQRVAKLEQAVRQADENARRKAERQRRAAEEEQARLEQEQRDRERRAQEDAARQRAEREAAEARARVPAAPPAPKGPSSPQELCAGESNFFTRGLCESRACGQPEWQRHPFCVKRLEEQLHRLNPGG